MPAGLWKMAQWDTWRVLTRARAIENLAYTATCQNILGHESANAGLAMICSPEAVLAERSVEGVVRGRLRPGADPVPAGRGRSTRHREGLQGRRALAVVPAGALHEAAARRSARPSGRSSRPKLEGRDRPEWPPVDPRGGPDRDPDVGEGRRDRRPRLLRRGGGTSSGDSSASPRPPGSWACPGRCRASQSPGPPIRGLHPELHASLNGGTEFEYRAPMMAGDELVATTTIVDMKERTGSIGPHAAHHPRDRLPSGRRDGRDPASHGDQLLRRERRWLPRPRSTSKMFDRRRASRRAGEALHTAPARDVGGGVRRLLRDPLRRRVREVDRPARTRRCTAR